MTQITASEVNKLRKQTGAGMMDCKNALVDAKGDFELAIDVLRKKGVTQAARFDWVRTAEHTLQVYYEVGQAHKKSSLV